jgi:acyl dehydratase
MNQIKERYLEDFVVGQTFGSGRVRIDPEKAIAFAAEFDPQAFHLDEAPRRTRQRNTRDWQGLPRGRQGGILVGTTQVRES